MNAMPTKLLAAGALLFAALLSAAAQPPAPKPNPLERQYRDGETLNYRMNATNESWHYAIQADGVVRKDPTGVFYEEYRWSKMDSSGQPVALAPQMTDFRQRLTLDTRENPSVPDLSKVDPRTIGPITDMLTFYSDLWLANKTGQLAKPGDHFYMKYGVPSSWADGNYVLLGQSAVDFDLTWKSVDPAAKTATLVIRHVPPEKLTVQLPADWMQAPVGDRPNNWVGVNKGQDGKFEASVGEETFTVELTVSLTDGKILKGTLDNLVKTVARTCTDRALTQCDPAKPHQIERKIDIALLPWLPAAAQQKRGRESSPPRLASSTRLSSAPQP